ncbi:hypothetical protein CCACVL1_02149, partial [Corchorus capsularis]
MAYFEIKINRMRERENPQIGSRPISELNVIARRVSKTIFAPATSLVLSRDPSQIHQWRGIQVK